VSRAEQIRVLENAERTINLRMRVVENPKAREIMQRELEDIRSKLRELKRGGR